MQRNRSLSQSSIKKIRQTSAAKRIGLKIL